jgi:uncharacterized repeat protein (TIGR01451 family)
MVVGLFLCAPKVSAQPSNALIYTGGTITAVNWSTDSKKIVFTVGGTEHNGIEASNEGWYQYDFDTQLLTQSTLWPLQPVLTMQELEVFRPGSIRSFQAPIFLTPDGKYLLFVRDRVGSGGISAWKVWFGNRQALSTINVNTYVYNPYNGTIYFNIIWNTSSTAFTLNGTLGSDSTIVEYGQVPSTGSTAVNVYNERFFIIAGQIWQLFFPAFDTANTSHSVLLKVLKGDGPAEPTARTQELAIWKPLNPSTSQLFEGLDGAKVIGGKFSLVNESYLFLVTEQGLIQYNTTNGASVVLNSQINANWGDQAYFSPDGRKLVVIDVLNEYQDSVYVFDISGTPGQIPPPPPPPPSADLSLTLTSTDFRPGETLTLTVNYRNDGPGAPMDARVTLPVPRNTTFQSATGGLVYNVASGVWQIGKIISGGSGVLTLRVRVDSDARDVISQAIIGSPLFDPNINNNRSPRLILTVTN